MVTNIKWHLIQLKPTVIDSPHSTLCCGHWVKASSSHFRVGIQIYYWWTTLLDVFHLSIQIHSPGSPSDSVPQKADLAPWLPAGFGQGKPPAGDQKVRGNEVEMFASLVPSVSGFCISAFLYQRPQLLKGIPVYLATFFWPHNCSIPPPHQAWG